MGTLTLYSAEEQRGGVSKGYTVNFKEFPKMIADGKNRTEAISNLFALFSDVFHSEAKRSKTKTIGGIWVCDKCHCGQGTKREKRGGKWVFTHKGKIWKGKRKCIFCQKGGTMHPVVMNYRTETLTQGDDSNMVFVSAPYYHFDKDIIHSRVAIISKYCGRLLTQGKMVITPVCFGQTILNYCSLPNDFAFWDKISFALLSKCTEMHVLKLEGWKTSKGVGAEIAHAKKKGIKIKYINP